MKCHSSVLCHFNECYPKFMTLCERSAGGRQMQLQVESKRAIEVIDLENGKNSIVGMGGYRRRGRSPTNALP